MPQGAFGRGLVVQVHRGPDLQARGVHRVLAEALHQPAADLLQVVGPSRQEGSSMLLNTSFSATAWSYCARLR